MKLVQLLAKELKEWPNGVDVYAQDTTGSVFPWIGSPDHDGVQWIVSGAADVHMGESRLIHGYSACDDHMTANVTKSQWQAEREKMNKPKWIRHRGGWMPVGAATIVEVRLRCGDIQKHEACEFLWRHKDCDSAVNIMAYRVIEETKDQEIEEVNGIDTAKTPTIEYAFGDKDSDPKDLDWKKLGTLTYKLEIDATEATKEVDSLVAKWGQIESPLKWRDEIIELEAYEEEFRREREKLICKLESEGFRLIDHMTPVFGEALVDMDNWNNWENGDIIEVIKESETSNAKAGLYTITGFDSSHPKIELDERYFPEYDNMKFVRRP